MLRWLERYFVWIAVDVENADSHKHVETNGRSAVTVESDDDGYSVLSLSQKLRSFFPGNSSSNLESEDSLANSS